MKYFSILFHIIYEEQRSWKKIRQNLSKTIVLRKIYVTNKNVSMEANNADKKLPKGPLWPERNLNMNPCWEGSHW